MVAAVGLIPYWQIAKSFVFQPAAKRRLTAEMLIYSTFPGGAEMFQIIPGGSGGDILQ
jgi:hypothetical protein